MKTARRGPTLFEAMSKAPTSASPRDTSGFLARWRSRHSQATGHPIVAEALSEAEAQEELARRQAIEAAKREQQADHDAEKRAKQTERAALKAARQEEKTRRRAEAIARGGAGMRLTLGTAGNLGLLGLLCAIVLAAYSLGRQSAGNARYPTVAALSNREESPVPDTKSPPTRTDLATPRKSENPELAQLLQKPAPLENRGVRANQPARMPGDSALAGSTNAPAPEQLNYLQIESFLITRDRNGEQLAADLAHVRKFLQDRGIRTFARKKGNGFVVFAEEGIAPGKEHATQREALKKKIQQLGQEYRAAGGQYQFKGCLFVSYETTRTGDPV